MRKKSHELWSNLVILEEEIIITRWDPNTLDDEKMTIYLELHERKKEKARLRRDHKQKKVLHDIKDILLDDASGIDFNVNLPILD